MGFVVLVALLLGATPAVDLEAGDPAPYAGTLVPTEVAIGCATCVKVNLPLCQAKATAAAATYLAVVERLTTERDAQQVRGDNLAARLELRSAPPPVAAWYEHPALWTGVGLVVGVTVGILVGREL